MKAEDISTEISQVSIPDSKELETQAKGIVGQAQAFQITDADSFTQAATFRDRCTERAEQAEALFRPSVDDAHKLHKKLLGLLKACADPFTTAGKIVKQKMIAYDEEQKRIAEKKRLELERQEREKAEQEALEVAALLEAAGQKEEAETVLSEPVQVAPVTVRSDVPKVEGFSYRPQYSAKVTDLKALARAAVAGLVPIQAIQANEVFLNQQARSLKEALSYPGVELVKLKV